ncbi:MAG: AraC family transcriptional regulator, partial [Pseudomonadota bacterium]
SNGAMIFVAPRQVIQWDSQLIIEQKGFSIIFHEDFLKGTELAHQIKKYGFFSYSVNEALHLSPKEEKQMESIVENIEVDRNDDFFLVNVRTGFRFNNIEVVAFASNIFDEEYILSRNLQQISTSGRNTRVVDSPLPSFSIGTVRQFGVEMSVSF